MDRLLIILIGGKVFIMPSREMYEVSKGIVCIFVVNLICCVLMVKSCWLEWELQAVCRFSYLVIYPT